MLPAPFLGWRASASSEAAIISSKFHSASTGSAYFQFSTSPCSVIRICPEKSCAGCARIARCVGPPPRPTVPPRPWNRRSFTLHSRATAMQLTVRFVYLPGAGEHSAVFIRIGVPQHHFLPASPGIQQRLIGRTPTTNAASFPLPRAASRSTQKAAPASVPDRLRRRAPGFRTSSPAGSRPTYRSPTAYR